MKPMTFSETVSEFNKTVNQVGERFTQFPWEKKEVYGQWLAQTYFYVRHTTSLICLTAAKFGPDKRDEHGHAIEHLSEENQHDMLVYNDYVCLNNQKIDETDELVETSLFYQNQYFVIDKWGPASHKGYYLLLEGLSASYGPDVYSQIKHLYPEGATRFLKVHADLDQQHFRSGMMSLEMLSPEDRGYAVWSLRQSAYLYLNILGSISNSQSIFTKKAA